MATAFTRNDFFIPTVQGVDTLNMRHANTMLAQVTEPYPYMNTHLVAHAQVSAAASRALLQQHPERSAWHVQVNGYVACYEVTGNESCRLSVLNFVDMLVANHSWPTGGSNAAEKWGEPMRMGDLLTEVCSGKCKLSHAKSC